MIELLKIEWLKFRKNNVIIILSGFFLLLFPWVILVLKRIFSNVPPPLPNSIVFYEFPTVWDYQGYAGSWFVCFCLGFMMLFFITSEVGNKTMRQAILNGQTRKEFFQSKLLLLFVVSVIATIVYFFSSLILGMFHTKGMDFEIVFDNNMAPLKFFLMCLGYLSMAMFFGFWIRRGTLAILIYFSYVMFLEKIIRYIILYYYRSKATLYFPSNVFSDLMVNPFYKAPGILIENEFGFKPILTGMEAMIASALFIGMFVTLSWLLFKKKDI